MKTSATGLTLIKESEGCRLTAYPDPGNAPPRGNGQPWTIGVGHVGNVRPGDSCSEAQAMDWLRHDAAAAEAGVARLVHVPLTQGQFDALVSFVFNLGEGALAGSTLLRKLNAGDLAGAAAEFPKWCHAGTAVLPGLVTRRARERALFEGEEL
jgi:lysozyme